MCFFAYICCGIQKHLLSIFSIIWDSFHVACVLWSIREQKNISTYSVPNRACALFLSGSFIFSKILTLSSTLIRASVRHGCQIVFGRSTNNTGSTFCLPSKFKSSKLTTTNPKTMRGCHGFRSKSASPCFWFQSNETCHQFVPPWSSSSCDWLDWTQEQIKDGSPSNENIWTLKMSPMLSYTLYKYKWEAVQVPFKFQFNQPK